MAAVEWKPPALATRAAEMAKPVFVGRATEVATAEQAWAAVCSGARQLIFIGGEPGAGKSRLAEEIAAAMHRRGAVVLVGGCSSDSGRPYQPFVECVEHLLGATAEGALAASLPDSACELLRLTPLVLRHRPDLRAPLDLESGNRRALFDALVELLRSVGEQRPVVCVLEDLHWAGTPTLQLLSHLAQCSARSRLLLLGTHRTTAPDRSDELAFAIADLYRLDGVRRLDLPGLSTGEVVEYLVAEGGLTVRRARQHAAALRDQTGGNPFFLREVLRDVPSGATAGARRVGTRAPVSVRDVLQRRLARLTSGERDVLETAAVLGDGADARILIAACAGDAGETLAAIDAAARFGLMNDEEFARGRIAFPHMLTRQAVLDLLGSARRARLHARVGEVAESFGCGSSHVVRQLAYHFAQASLLGYGAKAAGYLVQAAREAERSLTFEDAAASYGQAADVSDGTESDREELWFAAARSHVRAGDFASARDLYRRLLASGDRGVRLRAAVGYEDAESRPGTWGGDARALLAHALEENPPDPADPDYVWALASLGRAMVFTGDTEQGRVVCEQALGYARQLDDQRLLVHALQMMMWLGISPESMDNRFALAEELTVLARRSGDGEAVGIAATLRCVVAYLRADQSAWTDAVTDLEQSVRDSGQPFLAYLRGCMDYVDAFLHGEFLTAERIAEDLLELGRSFGPDDTEGPYGLQMYLVRRETGALDAIRPLIDAAPRAEDTWEPGMLSLYTELGMTDRARNLLSRLLERLDPADARRPLSSQWTAVLVFLVEAAVALRDREAAGRLRPLLTPHTGLQLLAGRLVAIFGPADAYLGALDSVLGDDESADRHFERAVAQSRALGSIPYRATTLTVWADHLRRLGDTASRSRAEALRDEARKLAASTGQVRLLRMLDADPQRPGGLTAREVEVLRQLVHGSSNRDIATRLGITENTAANHVRSILTKTGTTNRTQAAMMAVSRHWFDSDPGEIIR